MNKSAVMQQYSVHNRHEMAVGLSKGQCQFVIQYTVEVSRPGQPLDDVSDLLVQLQQSAATVFAQTGSGQSVAFAPLPYSRL